MFQRVADLFLLVMLRIIAIVSSNKHETMEFGVDELAMTALATGHVTEARVLQI